MLAQHVLGKLGACKAIEVADATANGTLLVEVILTVTLRTDVLIKRSVSLAALELAQDFNVAKLAQVAVETAFSRRRFGVDLGIELVYCKLAVGVATKRLREKAVSTAT